MVNLNRQIAVARARAGGFSAHVLPGAVGYDLPNHNAFLFEWDSPLGPAYAPSYPPGYPGVSSRVRTAMLPVSPDRVIGPGIRWTVNTRREFVVPGFAGWASHTLNPPVPQGEPRYFNVNPWSSQDDLESVTGPAWPYAVGQERAVKDSAGRARLIAGVPGYTPENGDYKAFPLGRMRVAEQDSDGSIDGYAFPTDVHCAFQGLTYEIDVKFDPPYADIFVNCQLLPPTGGPWQSIYFFYNADDYGDETWSVGNLYTEGSSYYTINTNAYLAHDTWHRFSVTYNPSEQSIYWHANGNLLGQVNGVSSSFWQDRLLWLTTFETQCWYPTAIGSSRVSFVPLYGAGSYTPRSLRAHPWYEP